MSISYGDLLAVGDRIQVQADSVLGTPEIGATITEVHPSWGYIVKCDDDQDDWAGPVNFSGQVLHELPPI